MKRVHVHVGVHNLDEAIRFYSAVFGLEPVKRNPDYAKWMVEDPHINFAISTRAGTIGLNHLGIQVDDETELEEVRERVKTAQLSVFDEGRTVCCYAHSD
ncbi:MAG: VOC family protein, partial [Gammaproteobacteria bacterium]